MYRANKDSPDWTAYLEAAEDMILEGLIEAVRCSLSYMAAHTEKGKVETPLMETKLNLVVSSSFFPAQEAFAFF